MLDPREEAAIAEQFGVARAQVRRDHLISHLLAAISDRLADEVIFFGGTALSRTLAPDGRLSEDIDLIARSSRSSTAEALETTLLRATRREFPGLRWQPALTSIREVAPAVLVAPDGTTVRVQLLSSTGYAPWPTERRPLVQRYSDAGPAELSVPTAPAFAAWKTTAWAHRATSRDLYDLWLLGRLGAITTDAAEQFKRFGPTNKPPSSALFTRAPDEQTWQRELAGQTHLEITASAALAYVRDTWLDVSSQDSDVGETR
ncbi:nucleotidyl transferase AbiEii/AbiGii toxin family protein [Actinopolyspora saharensis]|uniref:Nucleotidyl transferase AbiEii toxin, Type IV TA system n=1 Tax=Actinopolyspora saharensis TaxID=995062 RepID=A0A1H0YHU2_9ACTN|nr:nucleotidyl transferase AbiEii/AbiGii toxin family protein [Actinopolyspora saharensis]SDQ14722.1 Nucleotidyl transferase AbiEii toxin, Type IV TA system [Actinopolyspora saharensis]